MKYAKLQEGNLILAPNKIQRTIDGQQYNTYNPTGEMLMEQGWMPLIETEHGDAPVGFEYVPTYAEVSGEIVQSWTLVESELSAYEALSIITGGAL